MTFKEFETQYALGSLSRATKETIAADPNTSERILTILSKDDDGTPYGWYVRCAVAANPSTPVTVLRQLGKPSNDEDIVWAVKENPSAPKDVVKEITRFFDEDF